MKVYVVTGYDNGEASWVEGVYSTEERANTVCDKRYKRLNWRLKTAGYGFDVNEYELDEEK